MAVRYLVALATEVSAQGFKKPKPSLGLTFLTQPSKRLLHDGRRPAQTPPPPDRAVLHSGMTFSIPISIRFRSSKRGSRMAPDWHLAEDRAPVNNLREHLRNGTARRIISWIAASAVAAAVWYCWPDTLARSKEVLSAVQKGAFVTMAFAVTAYNFRTRVIDLLLRGTFKPDHLDRLARTARRCGARLTSLVVLFTLTSAAMGGATFLDFDLRR